MQDKAIRISLPEYDKISDIGFLHQMSVRETYVLHNHDFFELFYVPSGRAIHHINGKDEVVTAGCLEWIRPDDTHSYRFLNQYDMELLSIGIATKLVEEVISYLGITRESLLKGAMPGKILYTGTEAMMIRDLLLEIGKKAAGENRRQYAKAILPRIFYDLFEQTEDSDRFIPAWLNLVIHEMSEPENFIEGLPRMLQIANVAQEHLNREFKKYVQITPTEFINMKRVEYASTLLKTGKYNVAEVGQLCGYNTLSHFYTNFEKIYHESPVKYVKTKADKQK